MADNKENFQAGYIMLYRSVRKHWIWEDAKKLKWWLDILMEVNHKDRKKNIGNVLIECNRGQSINSLQTWGKRWGVSKDSARAFLRLLEKDNMIVVESVTKTTRLTVCNYDSYNNVGHDDQTHSKRTLDALQTHAHPNNNDKNYNNDKKEGANKNLPTPQELMNGRKEKFKDSLKVFLPTYGRDMLNSFFGYWTEQNKSGTKMRFELERVWDVKRRLETWASKDKNWKPKQQEQDTHLPDAAEVLRQIEERKKKTA